MNASAVSTILKEGMIVNTRLDNSNAWYYNILCKSKGNKVSVRLLDSYVQNVIMPGSTIVLKYSNEYFQYLFEGTVSEITVNDPAHVVVQVNKAEELINTRAFPRYDLYFTAQIKPLWRDVPFFCITSNIGLGGIAFLSQHQFDYGEENDVSIYLPNRQIIHAFGKVIRKCSRGNLFDYSMQFMEIDEVNSGLLSAYLQSIEEEWARLKLDNKKNKE